MNKTEAAKTSQRLSLCWSLTHLSDCPKDITKTRWSGASCAACAAHDLLAQATSSDRECHLLAVARNKYINAYFNEKAVRWLEEHPNLDTWTQADFDRAVEQWTGEASALWDNPPTPGQPA